MPCAWAQGNDDCFACHDDQSLKGTRGGQTISVYVGPDRLKGSVHAKNRCVDCHKDLSGADLPHPEELKAAVCDGCHRRQVEQHTRSLHGQAAAKGEKLAPRCGDCHGSHNIQSHRNPASPTAVMKIPFLCGRCHHEGSPVSLTFDIPQDRILENYSDSIHGEGLFKRGLVVSAVCTSCHTSHNILPHTDAESSIARANVAKTCTQCHALIETVHRKVIEGRLWEESPDKIPACVDCHSPHRIRRVLYPAGVANSDCLECHGKQDLAMERDGKRISLYVDALAMQASTHAKVACAQCHSQVATSGTRPCETITRKVDCSVCHAEVATQFAGGMHGELLAKGDPDAPGCLDCHERHHTKSKRQPDSPTYARNVPTLCARCHREGEKAAKRIHTETPNPVNSYDESIHGKGLVDSGLVVTATCSDCHTPHAPLPPADPRSSVNRANIATTCGKCHHGIEETFAKSIHTLQPGKTLDPNKRLPTCEDCHTSHQISRTDQANFRFLMTNQCGRCHQTEAETYFETYHGKVSHEGRTGSAGAAKCYDCHGTHDILPPADPRSHLSRDRVVETCGKCHAGSHRRFAGYLTHATHHEREKYPFLFWAFWGMTALLVGTLTFAFLHTVAWLIRLFLTRREWRQTKAAAHGGKSYRRFTPFQSRLHLVMLVSFFTLSLTGMALKFSYMRWAQLLSGLLGGFAAMGVLHRLAAITLIADFAVHAWGLAKLRKEKGLSWFGLITHPSSIMFNLTDVREILGSFRWFLGRGERPRYGRYTYWEKFDYFAVLWGVVVIGSTGFVLWFPEALTYVLPGWSINVATIIHSDEALLAVGFIFTIHFFNTHFRPDKFPMDPVIFTGRVPVAELKFDKPREYEEMANSGELEARLEEPAPAKTERWYKVLGLTALAIGLSLVGLIIYTMVFGYR
ncbi:MAG: cytochrome c3 family protein [Deltaproteobacteria bacterium]|nr:cytochrome c3 family protein [Deltaproteobacteria bacterium]